MKNSITRGKQYRSPWWAIDLPMGWEAKDESECASFRAHNPLGVLQISAIRKPNGIVTREDLLDFASEALTNRTFDDVSTMHTTGITGINQIEGLYWQEWWLRSGSMLIYATYNIVSSMKESEKADVQYMIDSLREE